MAFEPVMFQCTRCEGLMMSKWSGMFSSCQCGDSFVDQTPHYTRSGGGATPLDYLILTDLKRLTGIGYEKDDVLNLLEEIAHIVFTPSEAVQREIYSQYESCVFDLGGSTPKELVEAGRGKTVVEYLQSLLGTLYND